MEITEAHKNVISVRQKKKRWLITYCLNLTKRRFGYFATLTIIKVSVILCFICEQDFFIYFKFLNQHKLISVTSEEFLLIYPIKYNRAGDDEGQSVFVLRIAVVYSPVDV